MGVSLHTHDRNAAWTGWSYSGLQSYRKHLLEAARDNLGQEVWDTYVSFSWMLDPDSDTPVYDPVDRSYNYWLPPTGAASKPMWLPGLLAFVDISDCNPRWSWGECCEIVVMLEVLDPTSQALPVFTHAAGHRCDVFGR